jgi:uncharacterized membrane protein
MMRPVTLVRALSVAGMVVAAYLTYEHARGLSPVCFGGTGGGCQTIATSRYSAVHGVPIAAAGLAGYVAMFAMSFGRSFTWRAVALGTALFAAGFSAYLTWLELGVIHAVCQWCVASAVVAAALLVATAWWTRATWPEALVEQPMRVTRLDADAA